MMTLRHYRIFVSVCDTMNMTEAGEKLYLSQSAVSQAIAELERHYDTRLFERLSRKLYLTPSGQKLLSYARHIVRIHEETDYEMRMLREEGYLRIGASVTIGTCILPELIKDYQAKHNKSKIEVYENNTEIIEKMLLSDQIDLGVVEGDINSGDIISMPFMQDELILVCGSCHPLLTLPKIAPRELEKENFIIRETGSGTRKTFENVMDAHQLGWHAGWICNNADTIKSAVAKGLGITVISKRAVKGELARGELIPLKLEELQFLRSFKICYHKNKFLSDIMNSFVTWLIEASANGPIDL